MDAPLIGIEEYQKSHAAAGRPATADDGHAAISAPPTASATTRPGLGATGAVSAGPTEVLSPQDEALRAEDEKRQKEEDEFLKLESIFISELGIDPSQLASLLPK